MFREILTESIPMKVIKQAMIDTSKEAEDMVVKNWDEFTPRVCNNGFCDIFAGNLTKKLKGAETYSTEWSDGGKTFGHVWIKYKGKFYDAEVPKGVSKLEDIPYIKRVMDIRGEVPDDIEVY